MRAYPTLTDVKPMENYMLVLTYGDSEQRVYDFKPNFEHEYYRPLSNINLFQNVSVNDGEIEWITGQDFCPHTLYEQSIPI